MNDELGRICSEEVVAYFKALPHHMPGGSKEEHENSR
jgi:hypothetical protein